MMFTSGQSVRITHLDADNHEVTEYHWRVIEYDAGLLKAERQGHEIVHNLHSPRIVRIEIVPADQEPAPTPAPRSDKR